MGPEGPHDVDSGQAPPEGANGSEAGTCHSEQAAEVAVVRQTHTMCVRAGRSGLSAGAPRPTIRAKTTSESQLVCDTAHEVQERCVDGVGREADAVLGLDYPERSVLVDAEGGHGARTVAAPDLDVRPEFRRGLCKPERAAYNDRWGRLSRNPL